jgi:hypothetical protein
VTVGEVGPLLEGNLADVFDLEFVPAPWSTIEVPQPTAV